MARRSRPVSAYRNIPIIGSVAAGSPLLAVENSIGHLSIGDDFETSDIVFAYVVEGDDMDGAGIMDGDHIVIQSPETAETGDAVLVKAAGRFFVRRYLVSGSTVHLFREQQARGLVEDTKIVDFEIVGIVVGLLRKYF